METNLKVGQRVWHTVLCQECTVVVVREEPAFTWSDGQIDPALDWVDVRLDDGTVLGGDARAFRKVAPQPERDEDEAVDHILDETCEEELILDIITMTRFAVWRTQCIRMTVQHAMSFGCVGGV